MSFREVPGQERVAAFFRRAISTERLAHAYILVGPQGLGQQKLARAVAEFLFCENRADDACGTCRNCRRMAHGNFPDFHWFVREEGKRDLPVEQIELLLGKINLKPVESRYKVFVLEEAERLNVASANRLLKILEEPPPHSLLLLLAQDVRDFLSTILSRCQVIRLRPLSTAELTRRLVKESGCNPERAAYLSRFTMGSPEMAKELAEDTFFEDRAWMIDHLATIEPSRHFAVADELEKRLGGEKDAGQVRRERLATYLDVAALFYRDVLAAALGAGDDDLLNCDRIDDVRRLASTLSVARIERVLADVERMRYATTFSANRKLLLSNLAYAVADARSV